MYWLNIRWLHGQKIKVQFENFYSCGQKSGKLVEKDLNWEWSYIHIWIKVQLSSFFYFFAGISQFNILHPFGKLTSSFKNTEIKNQESRKYRTLKCLILFGNWNIFNVDSYIYTYRKYIYIYLFTFMHTNRK